MKRGRAATTDEWTVKYLYLSCRNSWWLLYKNGKVVIIRNENEKEMYTVHDTTLMLLLFFIFISRQ